MVGITFWRGHGAVNSVTVEGGRYNVLEGARCCKQCDWIYKLASMNVWKLTFEKPQENDDLQHLYAKRASVCKTNVFCIDVFDDASMQNVY